MDMAEMRVSIWAQFEVMEAEDKCLGSNGHDGGGR